MKNISFLNIFNRMTALVTLFFYTAAISGQEYNYLNLREEAVLNNFLERAEFTHEKSEWERLTQYGVESVVSMWVTRTGFSKDKLNFESINKEVDLSYQKWLIDSFFYNLESTLGRNLKEKIGMANNTYLYVYNSEGEMERDENGDIILKKLDELDADYLAWKELVSNGYNKDLEELDKQYTTIRVSLEDLYGQSGNNLSNDIYNIRYKMYKDSYIKELDILCRNEMSKFYNTRVFDQYSLRKKSEGEKASEVARNLISQANKNVENGLNLLANGLDQIMKDPGLNTGGITPESWREDFTIEFNKGMSAWQKAEEKLHSERLQWETDVNENINSGSNEWALALKEINKSKEDWENKLRDLISVGEGEWTLKENEINFSISNAREELERGLKDREKALQDQLTGLIDIIGSSSSVIKSANESIEYILDKQNDSNDQLYVDSLNNWNEIKNTYEEYVKSAEGKLRTVYGFVLNEESMNSLIIDIDSGETDDLLGYLDIDKWESIYLDEHQITLLKANLLKEYWDNEFDIAQSVYDYANNLSSERDTQAETVANYNRTLVTLNQSKDRYNKCIKDLEEIGKELDTLTNLDMVKAQANLKKVQNELEDAKDEYDQILAALKADGSEDEKERLTSYYNSLLEKTDLVNSTEYNTAIADYLLSVKNYEDGLVINYANEILTNLKYGDDVSPSLEELEKYRTNLSSWFFDPNQLDFSDLGLAADSETVIELRREQEKYKLISGDSIEKEIIRIRAEAKLKQYEMFNDYKLGARLDEIDLVKRTDMASWDTSYSRGRNYFDKAVITKDVLLELVDIIDNSNQEIDWLELKSSNTVSNLSIAVLYNNIAEKGLDKETLKDYYTGYIDSINRLISYFNNGNLDFNNRNELDSIMDSNLNNFFHNFNLFVIGTGETEYDLSVILFKDIENEERLLKNRLVLYERYKNINPNIKNSDYSANLKKLTDKLDYYGINSGGDISKLYSRFGGRSDKTETYDVWCSNLLQEFNKLMEPFSSAIKNSVLDCLNSGIEYGLLKQGSVILPSLEELETDIENINTAITSSKNLLSLLESNSRIYYMNTQSIIDLYNVSIKIKGTTNGEYSDFIIRLDSIIIDLTVQNLIKTYSDSYSMDHSFIDGIYSDIENNFGFLSDKKDLIVNKVMYGCEKNDILKRGNEQDYRLLNYTYIPLVEEKTILNTIWLSRAYSLAEGYSINTSNEEFNYYKDLYNNLYLKLSDTEIVTSELIEDSISNIYTNGDRVLLKHILGDRSLFENITLNNTTAENLMNSSFMTIVDNTNIEHFYTKNILEDRLTQLDFTQELEDIDDLDTESDTYATDLIDIQNIIRNKIDLEYGNFLVEYNLYSFFTEVTNFYNSILGRTNYTSDQTEYNNFVNDLISSSSEDELIGIELAENILNLNSSILSHEFINELLQTAQERTDSQQIKETIGSYMNSGGINSSLWLQSRYNYLSENINVDNIVSNDVKLYGLRLKMINYNNSCSDIELNNFDTYISYQYLIDNPTNIITDYNRTCSYINLTGSELKTDILGCIEISLGNDEKYNLLELDRTLLNCNMDYLDAGIIKNSVYTALNINSSNEDKAEQLDWINNIFNLEIINLNKSDLTNISNKGELLAYNSVGSADRLEIEKMLFNMNESSGAAIVYNSLSSSEKDQFSWFKQKYDIKNNFIQNIDGNIDNYLSSIGLLINNTKKNDLHNFIAQDDFNYMYSALIDDFKKSVITKYSSELESLNSKTSLKTMTEYIDGINQNSIKTSYRFYLSSNYLNNSEIEDNFVPSTGVDSVNSTDVNGYKYSASNGVNQLIEVRSLHKIKSKTLALILNNFSSNNSLINLYNSKVGTTESLDTDSSKRLLNRNLYTLSSYLSQIENLKKTILSSGKIIDFISINNSDLEIKKEAALTKVNNLKKIVNEKETIWQGIVNTFIKKQEDYSKALKSLNSSENDLKREQKNYDIAESIMNYATTSYIGDGLDKDEAIIDPSVRYKKSYEHKIKYSAQFDVLNNLFDPNNLTATDFINRDEQYKKYYETYRTNFLKEVYIGRINDMVQGAISKQKKVVDKANIAVEDFLNKELVSAVIPFSESSGSPGSYVDYCTLKLVNNKIVIKAGTDFTGKIVDGKYYRILNGVFTSDQDLYKYFYFGNTLQDLTKKLNATTAKLAYEKYCAFVTGNPESKESDITFSKERRDFITSLSEIDDDWKAAIWYKKYISSKDFTDLADDDSDDNYYYNILKNSISPEAYFGSNGDFNQARNKADYNYTELKNRLISVTKSSYDRVKSDPNFDKFYQYSELGVIKIPNNFTEPVCKGIILDYVKRELDRMYTKEENFRNGYLIAALATTWFGLPTLIALAAVIFAAICNENMNGIEEHRKDIRGFKNNLPDSTANIQKILGNRTSFLELDKIYSKELDTLNILLGKEDESKTPVSQDKLILSVGKAAELAGYSSLDSFLGLTENERNFIKNSNTGNTPLSNSEILNYLLPSQSAISSEDRDSVAKYLGAITELNINNKKDSRDGMELRSLYLKEKQKINVQKYSNSLINIDLYLQDLNIEQLKNVKTDSYYLKLLDSMKKEAVTTYINSLYNERSHQSRLLDTQFYVLGNYNLSSNPSIISYYMDEVKLLKINIEELYREKLESVRFEKESGWSNLIMDINNKKELWRETIKAINRRGSKDWTESLKTYSKDNYDWIKNIESLYKLQSKEWDSNYAEFLNRKTLWIENLAVKTSVAGTSSVVGDLNKQTEAEIINATKNSLVEWGNSKSGIDSNYISNLISKDFNKLLSYIKNSSSQIDNINSNTNGFIGISNITKNGVKDLLDKYSKEDKEEIEKQLLLITAYKAKESIELAKNNLTESLDKANENVNSSINKKLTETGYNYESSTNIYSKTIVVDQTIVGGEQKKNAIINGFEFLDLPEEILNYKSEFNSVSKESLLELTSKAVEMIISSAMNKMTLFRENLFGKESSEKETISGTDNVNIDKDKEALWGLISYNEEVTESQTVTKEIDKLDGSFNLHVGYAPELKSNPDFTNAENEEDFESEIKFDGVGEMGRIIKSFLMYNLLQERGWAEKNKDLTDRRIFDDDSAPDFAKGWTMRKAWSTANNIAGIASGAPWLGPALNILVDSAFLANDYVQGKGSEEKLLNYGQATLLNVGSAAIGYGSASIATQLGSGLAQEIGKSVGSSLISNILSSSISSVELQDGSLRFNSDKFIKDTVGDDAMNNYGIAAVSAGVTYGLAGSLDGFSVSDIEKNQAVASFGGDLAKMGLEYNINGETSFNILNLSDFTKGNMNFGLLQMKLSKNKGFEAGFGQGGVGLNAIRLGDVANGADAFKEQQQIRFYGASGKVIYGDDYKGVKDAGVALRSNYSFGGESGRAQNDSLFKGDSILRVGMISGEAGKSEMVGDTKLIDIKTLGNKGDFVSQLYGGLVLNHESYRDGIQSNSVIQQQETVNAVAGHTQMAIEMMLDFKQNIFAGYK
ncbi:MAG: hypothetical protein JXR64_02135, partial [Spirochaetales bacterium]|nr:hypothetical protein [Spirochaetales bacterium]